jgi:hypothetical protein
VRARRWARAAAGALCAVAAFGVAGSAWAGAVEGPTVFLAANGWTDCGGGLGGSERLTTVGTGPATGHALHGHRYCPTRAATVTYYFYAYDSSFRNICERPERACDPTVPFGAYAAVTLAMEPGDFEPGGRCHGDGCPVVAPLPAANGAAIRLVVAEAVDDTGRYGLTHAVRWDPTPIPEPPPVPEPPPPVPGLAPEPPTSEPPGWEPAPEAPAPQPPTPEPEPPAQDPPASEPPAAEPPAAEPPATAPPAPPTEPVLQLPAPGVRAPESPDPDTPSTSGPTADPPPAGGRLAARLRLA